MFVAERPLQEAPRTRSAGASVIRACWPPAGVVWRYGTVVMDRSRPGSVEPDGFACGRDLIAVKAVLLETKAADR